MKKILLISHDASLTGAPKSILLIGKLLKEQGHEIRWIVGKQGPRNNDFEQVPTQYWLKDLSNANLKEKLIFRLKGGLKGYHDKLVSWVKNWDPDLIINNTVVNGTILEVLSILNKPVISRIPEMQSVMAFYDTFDHSTSKVFKYSDKIVAASNAVKEQIVQNWDQPEEKVQVIYTGSDMEPLPREKLDRFTVSACGTLISRKGIDLFLLVAKECLKKGHNNIRFQWIGGNPKSLGYYEAIEDIRKLGLEDNVEIITETKDVRPFLAKSDLFLMTSKEDPFPIVNLEAILHQLPVICFESSGGAVDIVNKGGGTSVPYMDTHEMAITVMDYYKDSEKMIDSDIVMKHFTTKRMIEEWLKLV